MDPRTELVDVIRRVRNRWRLRLALRGAVVVVAGTVLALLLSASGLESLRFSAPAIITFRIVTVAVFVGLLFYGLVWPLRRRVTDAQVAMYLEECDPTLEAAILSAVEATSDGGSPAHSPRLVEKLVEQAIEQCRDARPRPRHRADVGAAPRGARWPPSPRRRAAPRVRPAYLRHGLSALLVISRSAEASSPYSIEVTPGQHQGAARRRSGGQREAGRLHVERRQRDDADRRRTDRSSACRSSPAPSRARSRACCSTSRRPPSTTSSRTASARGTFTLTVVDLPTVAAARARVPLPRLHRPRAAQGRRRRRRRDPRHRRRAARRADDDDARRQDSAERRRARCR